MLLKWKIILAAFVVSAIGSFGAGVWVTYKYYRVERLEAANRKLTEDGIRFREVLDIGAKLDDENYLVEVSNTEIANALRTKIREQGPPVVPNQPAPPVCVTADSMRELRRLK